MLTLLERVQRTPVFRRLAIRFFKHCNWLADKGRCHFLAQYPEVSTKQCFGRCSLDAEVGDHIIRVKGLEHLLLVRPCDGVGNAVKLVSPVVMYGALENGRRIPPSESIELESRYIEYCIH